MKRFAIIGASYLQLPLIICAKEMGLETHVFAWEKDADGKEEADFFYPISITEKERILEKCIELQICGICSIASDLASITVNYIAQNMGLIGNSRDCVRKSTNKYDMRGAFLRNGLPSPQMLLVHDGEPIPSIPFPFPVVVKPTDRSGSRGIHKVYKEEELQVAVERAISESFEKKALIEEFADGEEYSVEYISYRGEHFFLAITKKYTTGEPHYVEIGHIEPAELDANIKKKIQEVTETALNALEIENGASHTELKIDKYGNFKLIEIGARMGGDLIGSDLVPLSTGFNYVKAVISISIGQKPFINVIDEKTAAVRYIICEEDNILLERIRKEAPALLIKHYDLKGSTTEILNSSDRKGCFVIASQNRDEIKQYLKI